VRALKLGAVALALVGTTGGIYGYELYNEHYPSTDDAYVVANAVHVAPQVGGEVSEVFVRNNQRVTKGEPLYQIADEPFRYVVEAAKARLDMARQTVAGDSAAVASAEAEVHRQEVLLINAEIRAKRNRDLQTNNYIAQQSVDDAESDYRSAKAGLAVARAKLNEAREKLGSTGDNNQSIREAQAALDQAQWELSHTTVKAGCNGYITEKHLNPGDAVNKGVANFVQVCDDTYWIDANYKETDLQHIRAGQKASITIDMYPEREFHGEVESVGAASGVAFSLLPPQNASGNWIKITQRVPVRIRVLDPDADHPLRVGTSSVVRIDTQS
jgi:membrane fusion protein, multidrug efflux system